MTPSAALTFSPKHEVLQGYFNGCNSAQANRKCSVAIHRFCNDQVGFSTGFGPQEQNSTIAVVACVKDSAGTTFLESVADVENLVAGCDLSSTTVSTACRQAMASLCQTEDSTLRGGFGPSEKGTKVRVGCVEPQLPWNANSVLPQSPALPLDVLDRQLDLSSGQGGATLKYQAARVHTSLASNRSLSFDGRLLVVQQGAGLQFRVQTPEIFDRPISQQQLPGKDRSYEEGSWGSLYGFDVGATAFHAITTSGGAFEGRSTALCDPHQGSGPFAQVNRQQSVPGRQSNPSACDASGNPSSSGDHDCYNLVVVTVYDTGTQDELWATPVRVVVANPKRAGTNGVNSLTNRALVVDVQVLSSPQIAPFPAGEPRQILEPNITGDGRLLVIQGDGMIRYSVIPQSEEACDISQWSSFNHIYEMHDDPLMADYGVAKFPLRDFENQELSPSVPGNHQVRAGYPWIDRDGDNLMFMLGQSTLFYVDENEVAREKFEVVGHPFYGTQAQIPCGGSCNGNQPLHPTTRQEVEDLTDHLPRVGLTLVGLWTQGKMFSPDSRNNNVDATVPMGAPFHRLLRLYSDVPAGSEVGPSARTLINSLENQFSFDPDLRPDRPREVVWQLSSQGQTDEVAFDDVTDPAALIVASMGVAINATRPDAGRFQDGFVYTGRVDGEGFQFPAHIANYAAATRWNLPAFGYLLGGARAEPIAAGGYRGKGLWLDGVDDRLEYLVPEQAGGGTEWDLGDWFFSLSIDPRQLSTSQRLLTKDQRPDAHALRSPSTREPSPS